MVYFSQYGQDEYIHELFFHDRKCGTFIEFGALDGLLHSNSLFFERQFDWTGILLEPNPYAYELLSANRPGCITENVAISNVNGVAQFLKIAGNLYGWSGIVDDIEPEHQRRIEQHIPHDQRVVIDVQVRDFKWLAEKHHIKNVDFISIDTEGTEEKILRSFPWNLVTVSVFCIENNFGNDAIREIMQAHGYCLSGRVGTDDIYYSSVLFPQLCRQKTD